MSASHPTAHTVPAPVLFNAWKHHAAWVRERIAEAVTNGVSGLDGLSKAVVVIGAKVMDLYTGRLSPWEVGERVLEQLRAARRLERTAFEVWLGTQGGFAVTELPDDGSRWVLRAGDDARYVHLHPARYSPHALRVSGMTLKSAILANALALTRGLSSADLATLNDARRRFLALPPVAKLTAGGGVGEILGVLRCPPAV